jgi:hypothetical protein
MTEPAICHFVFVDFENVPNVDLGLILDPSTHVTLLLGKNQKSLSLPMVQHIQRLGGRIKLVEVGASGRNALDLTLACYLGQALAGIPGAQFTVISKDKDFDAMIAHLQGKGTKIARQDSLAIPSGQKAPAKKTAAAKPAKQSVPAPSRSAKAVARLMNPGSRNRPATHKALVAHLKTSFGKEASDANVQDTINELMKRGLNVDASGHVDYPSQ